MIRQEDIIKQSGIIEYLEDRIKYHKKRLKKLEKGIGDTNYWSCYDIIEELELALNHFKEMSKDVENK